MTIEFDKVVGRLYDDGASSEDILRLISRIVASFTPVTVEQSEEQVAKSDERFRIKKLVEMFGVPKHVKGYKYLIDAVSCYRADGCPRMGAVYSGVAKMNDTSLRKVERGIRHVVQMAFSEGAYSDLVFLFGENLVNSVNKPTNSEVIATLAERVDTVSFSDSNNGFTNANEFDRYVNSLKEKKYSDNDILYAVIRQINKDSGTHEIRKMENKEDNENLNMTRLLETFGVPKNLKGYQYITDAILLYRSDPNLRITQDLYPAIAEKYKDTPQRVERAIRYVVIKACERCSSRALYDIFGNSLIKGQNPSNLHAIASLAEKLDYMD